MTAAVTPNPMKYIIYSNRVAGTTVFHIGGTHRGTTFHWVRCFTGTHLLTRRAGSPSGSSNQQDESRNRNRDQHEQDDSEYDLEQAGNEYDNPCRYYPGTEPIH